MVDDVLDWLPRSRGAGRRGKDGGIRFHEPQLETVRHGVRMMKVPKTTYWNRANGRAAGQVRRSKQAASLQNAKRRMAFLSCRSLEAHLQRTKLENVTACECRGAIWA